MKHSKYWSQQFLSYKHNRSKALLHLIILCCLLLTIPSIYYISSSASALAGSSSSSSSSNKSSLSFFSSPLFHPSKWFNTGPQPKTIFVSIASYRDDQCHKTIKDMYEKAEDPSRIYVGVYQQHGEKELDCLHTLDQYDFVYLSNIRIKRVHFSEGKGPCVARYECSQMFDHEDYFFQLDAHTRFIQHWDTVMLSEADNASKQVNHEKVVLSHYPLEYHVEDDSIPKDHTEVTTQFCNGMYNSDGIIQPMCGIVKKPELYNEVPFSAGGMMWGPGSMIYDVPYDPDLPFLFHGEELLYSIRLHAKGYRMYGPKINTVFHFYNRPTFPKVWVDAPDYYKISKDSVGKVKRTLLLADPSDMDGPRATHDLPPADVEYYYQKWGFDIKNKTSQKWC